MRLHEIIPDLRQQIMALHARLPIRWKAADGSDVWKRLDYEPWLAKQPDDALPDILAHFQADIAYLKANPKAKRPDPYVTRRSRKSLATFRSLLQRAGPMFATWMQQLHQDEPEVLQRCRKSPACMLDMIEEYLRDELHINVRPDGLITFWILEPETNEVIDELPVALYHYTSSRVIRSIRSNGLEGERDPVNQRVAPGVYLTTEQSGNAVTGYVRNAVRHHGGHGVMVTVQCYLNELDADPDDADIVSGRTQFLIDHVPSERIVAVERVSL